MGRPNTLVAVSAAEGELQYSQAALCLDRDRRLNLPQASVPL